MRCSGAFGIDGTVKHGIQHADEHLLVYPAGRHLCTFDLQSREVRANPNSSTVLFIYLMASLTSAVSSGRRQMNFMLQIDEVERITEVAISQNKKYLAAIELLRSEQYQVNQRHVGRGSLSGAMVAEWCDGGWMLVCRYGRNTLASCARCALDN